MKFPVDLLADVSQAELERLAHNYMTNLLHSNPDCPKHLTLSDSTQVTIDVSSVGFVPLYGSSDKKKILALFSPSDPFTAVALYLLNQWWSVDDILKTADPAREGVVEVKTIGERIVLYILNRVIYRAKEMSSEELPFLCHGEKENAKILWNNGEGVGFYSVKPSGSICNYFSTRNYQLPVMDSIFVRKNQRGKGFGLQMLEDFVLSFQEDSLGLRYPLTQSMYKVCEKYLGQYPGDTDLLWEVQSIGGPNQRTNIASKIQAINLSAVSKSLSFTEKSLVITEVTEKDVVMEAITTQIKEAESMKCTVEIVEEVTLLRATKEVELPVASRGRSSGSKQRKMGEKIKDHKSEKVIRIQDIEAETPREEQVYAQQKTELHNVSELVLTKGMFSVATEEKGEDVVDTAPEEEAATMPEKTATVLASQELEEGDVTSTLMTEEPQVEDNATPDQKNTSHKSQITVENVASEIEEAKEAEEKCQKKDIAMLLVSEEVLVHKEAESQKVGEATQIKVTDVNPEERVTQHVVSLSTHASSEDGETVKTGRTAMKTAQNETPRLRTQQHSKQEEWVKEETTAHDGGRVLRGRTVMTIPTPKCKYTQYSQKVWEELEKEVNELAVENEVYTADLDEGEEPAEITFLKEDVVAVEELREEKKQLEDEQLTNEEKTEKQEKPGVEDTLVKGSSTEFRETAAEFEKEQKGEEVKTSVIQDTQEVSDDELDEVTIVQKRALRGRHKVTKATKQSKTQKEEYVDLGTGSSAREEKALATDKQMEEHHQMKQEETTDKTEDISTEELTVGEEGTIPKAEEAAEDVIPSSVVNKEVQGATETISLMEADKEEVADDMIQEPDSVAAASETVIPDEAATSVEPQEKDTDSEIPKLHEATVILVDLKTTCHHLSVMEVDKTLVDEEYVAEKERVKLIAAEEKDVSHCVADEQKPDTEMLVLEDNRGRKEKSAETAKKEDSCGQEKEEYANVDEENSEAEESPVTETRLFRCGRNAVKASCNSTGRSNQQQKEDNIVDILYITKKEVDEAKIGSVGMEGQIEAMAKDAVTVTDPVEEKLSAISEMCADAKADFSVVDNVVEEQSEAIYKIFAEREVQTSGEECDQRKLVMRDEEVELPAVAVTRSVRSGGKTSKATLKIRGKKQQDEVKDGGGTAEKSADGDEPPVESRILRRGTKSVCRNRKQFQEEDEGPKESAEEAEEEDEEDTGLVLAEEPPKAGSEGKAPEINKIEVKEHVIVEVEKGVSKEWTVTEDKENTAGVTATEDNLVQEGEAETLHYPLPKPTSDIAILISSEEEATPSVATPSAEEQQSEEMAPQLSDLQRLTVVVVDLKNPHHEVIMNAEETMAEENIAVGMEKNDLVKVEEEGFGEKVNITIQDTGGGAEETAKEDVPKSGDDKEVSKIREEEPAEKQQQMIDQDKGNRLKEKDVTQNVENINPEMGTEEVEAAMQQNTSEEGQASSADEGKTSDDVAEKAVTAIVEQEQSTSTSEVVGTAAGESTQETLLITKDHKAKGASEEKEAPVIETRVQISREKKTVRATTKSKPTRRQDDWQDEEATGQKSTGDEPAFETRVLRKGRRSATATYRSNFKRARTQCQTEEEGEEETKLEESRDQVIEVSHEKKAADQKEEKTEPEFKTEKVQAVAEKSLTQQETLEVEQSAVLDTCVNRQREASVRESAEETPDTDEGNATEEEEPTEPRVLRSYRMAVKATPRSRRTKSQKEENDQEGTMVGKSADKDEPAIETRVLRKGRRSAPATHRCKSKRARKQCKPEEEGEAETTLAEETNGEEQEAGHEEKKEKAEEEGKSMEMKVKKVKKLSEVEEEEVESVAGGGSAVGAKEQMKVALTKGTAVLGKEDNSMAAGETGTDTVERNRELNAKKQTETVEKSSTGKRTGPPPDITVEDQEKETANLIDDRVVETDGEELATEEMELLEEELTESKAKTVDYPVVEDRSLRRMIETGADKAEDKAEENTFPKRTSIRKRPRVDSKEKDEEDGGCVIVAATDEEEDDVGSDEDKNHKKAECSADELIEKLEESSRDQDNNMRAIESSNEKMDILNLYRLDTAAGICQEDKEDEQNVSKEKVEPIEMGKRVLRGRSFPSVIITPLSKSRFRSVKVQKSKGSLADEEKSPQSSQKRSLHKKKWT
ncbi:uncharacterized protein LOC119891758 isoform X1 [Micropterus salmoides]|uniref:uncharacterized protein LOC119891758 isoform X1 n=1 Tax=Micropterus salmoides TaxID=27706 RepID=UPI0018ECC302|nr:uncharacterized protein LOC119891758 isoform X1 [Micropterus salmoides]XP_038559527.1 uncharacterized protein LOC119891758 isoform X1 [Micropterus salmoides]